MKIQIARALLAGISLGLAPLSANALTWTTETFRGQTQPLQKELKVAFSFKNSEPHPVAIYDVQTNCNCLDASTDKKVYQSGEAGVLTAIFTVGDRFGAYERSINVVTDDGRHQRLSVVIDVPETATVSPRTLDWSTGAPATEQSALVQVADGITLNFEDTLASNDTVTARLETVEIGHTYRVFVRPISTENVTNAAVRIRGKTPSGEPVIVSVYANVR